MFVQPAYSPEQVMVLDFLKAKFDEDPEQLKQKTFTAQLREHLAAQGMAKSAMGTALGFGSFIIKRELPANGVTALESVCAIDQEATLKENAAYIQRSLGLKAVHVNVVGTEGCFEAKKEVAQAKPGAPSVKFV